MFRRKKGAEPPSDRDHQDDPRPAEEKEAAKASDGQKWRFEEGAEIVPGRQALTLLGSGSDYQAYLAWDTELHTTVVVKILRPHLVTERRNLEHLRQEFQTLKRLSHPVIVRSFGAVTGGPRPHLVLEHLEGPRLSSLIRRYGPLPIEQLLPLSLQICSALHYLETQRIVHLDVKPANIVMSASPRLIDFSIARSWKQAVSLPRGVGTRKYMAPEQCAPGERGQVASPADIWGLGVTMYKAITGDMPFPELAPKEERDPLLKYPQLSMEPAPMPDDVPPQVAEPVMECLAPDPSHRPSAAELSEAFQQLVSLLPRARPLGRRRPRP